jgi:phage shock protein PspC (stress-responsive transcriptional regulator)
MNTTTDYPATDTSTTDSTSSRSGAWPLRRSAGDRMIAGVAGGIARSLGVDPIIVRVGFILFTLLGGAGLPLYLAGWLLIPDEGSAQSLAGEFIGTLSSSRN